MFLFLFEFFFSKKKKLFTFDYFFSLYYYLHIYVCLFVSFFFKTIFFLTILLLFISVFVSLYIFLPKNCFTFDYFSLLYNYLDICVCFYYLYINYGVFSFCYFLNLSSREIFVFDMFDFFLTSYLLFLSLLLLYMWSELYLFHYSLIHIQKKKKKKKWQVLQLENIRNYKCSTGTYYRIDNRQYMLCSCIQHNDDCYKNVYRRISCGYTCGV